jgi:hypothetical protein
MKGLTVPIFKITDHSLDEMHSAGFPDEILQKLATIKDQEIKGHRKMVELLQQTIGYQEMVNHQQVILDLAVLEPKKPRWGLKKPSLLHYIWKIVNSTILGAVILLAIFSLEWLTQVLFPEHVNSTAEHIKWLKDWASIGMFVVFLGVKVLHNLGIIED